jgi:hypothetical protein
MGGGSKQKNLIDTASESIDSCHRTALRRNDMLSAACFCPRGDDILVEACNNSPHGKRFFKTFVPISEKVVPLQRIYPMA